MENKDKAFWEAVVEVAMIFPIPSTIDRDMIKTLRQQLSAYQPQGADSALEDALQEDGERQQDRWRRYGTS